MIFDTDLARAAERHRRALRKAAKQQDAAQQAYSSPDAGGDIGTGKYQDGLATTKGGEYTSAGHPSVEAREYGIGKVGTVERAGLTISTTGGAVGVAEGPSGGRASRAGSSNGDVDGLERMGPVAPKSRQFKPRELLKIIVLGSSNVSSPE